MFEKEAEERARKLEENQTLGVYDNEEDLKWDEAYNSGEVTGYEVGFIEGAEFAYNKVNEWHLVKSGDLPPEDTKVLALMSDNEICIAHFYRINVWDKIGTVVAWKEITPPKEYLNYV